MDFGEFGGRGGLDIADVRIDAPARFLSGNRRRREPALKPLPRPLDAVLSYLGALHDGECTRSESSRSKPSRVAVPRRGSSQSFRE
jgi:hypothetical protein